MRKERLLFGRPESAQNSPPAESSPARTGQGQEGTPMAAGQSPPHGGGRRGRAHPHGGGTKSSQRWREGIRRRGKILPTMAGGERAAAARFRHPRPHGQGREGTPTAVVRNHPTAERRREHTLRRGDGQKNKSTLSSAFFCLRGFTPLLFISPITSR